ncbi:energy transducer TonB family protein [Sphingomonas sp. 37zxx]|uniref:energy transducer TonB family protein n=1 Tax=Sphingomonas sp. 37zxx TaxID=1550073 RepID=UPI00068EAC8B|nr:energy transducer TonB [Sphingomonas sp. 37zxx]
MMATARPHPLAKVGAAITRTRLTGPIILLVLAALLILALVSLWPAGDGRVQRERVVQEITVLQPPPPPVPPEPEEKIMEEEPEIIEPTDDPRISEEPVEQPSDTPSEAPSEQPSSEAAGLDRPADAGSDSFRLAAGKGGGLFGRGGGGGGGIGWGQYVEGHIQRALQRDARTRAARGSVRVTVNIDPGGRFVGAALRSSTGDAQLDSAIRAVLSSLPPLGRSRPTGQEGTTHATINLKRTDG